MREAGVTEHVAGSGRLIVRLSRPAEEGQLLYDRRGNKAARITELIGSVSAPFASAILLSVRSGRGGITLYSEGSSK